MWGGMWGRMWGRMLGPMWGQFHSSYIFTYSKYLTFEIFENIPSNCRPQFLDFFLKVLSAILLSTDNIEIIDRSIL